MSILSLRSKYGSVKITDTSLHSVEGNVIEILEDAVFTSIGEFGITDSPTLHGISSTQSAGEEIFAKTKFTSVQLASGSVRVGGKSVKSGVALWTPARLSNLVLWLDASVGVTIVTGVSEWQDQSSQVNHMVQPTESLQPALVNGINDLSVVQGDGLDDWLDFTAHLLLDNFSIISVIRGIGYWIGSDFSIARYINHNTINDTFRTGVATNVFSHNVDIVGGQLSEIYRTGTAVNSFKNGTASSNNPLVNAGQTDFRALYRRTSTYADIKIAEIIICNTEISADEKVAVKVYLATKYAITLP